MHAGEGTDVVPAHGQHAPVPVTALEDDRLRIAGHEQRLVDSLERDEVEDDALRALRRRLADVDLAEEDGHGHVVERGELLEPGQAEVAEAPFVGPDGRGAPATPGEALDLVEGQSALPAHRTESHADFAGEWRTILGGADRLAHAHPSSDDPVDRRA